MLNEKDRQIDCAFPLSCDLFRGEEFLGPHSVVAESGSKAFPAAFRKSHSLNSGDAFIFVPETISLLAAALNARSACKFAGGIHFFC
jgi:hypothetical protein